MGPLVTSRRLVIASGAAGLLVAGGLFHFTGKRDVEALTAAIGTGLGDGIFISIDNNVTIYCGLSEMGQGVFTGIATLIAEELDCSWEQIHVETGPVSAIFNNIEAGRDLLFPNYGFAENRASWGDWLKTQVASVAAEQLTGGSSSIADRFVRAREAGATARALLIAAAAAGWEVRPAECTTTAGIVEHPATQRKIPYGEVAAAVARIEPPGDVALKPRSSWKFIGAAMLPRKDLPGKVDGSAQYGIDVRRPQMLFAAVRNWPSFNGRLRDYWPPKSAAQTVGAARIFRLKDGIAAIADSTWEARKAVDAVEIDWDPGPPLDNALVAHKLEAALSGKLKLAYSRGNFAAAYKTAATNFSAEYRLPYLAHATMEPMNCTAEVHSDGVDVWVPTQAQTRAVKAAAEAAQVPESRVRIHTTLLGGGFGRRLEMDVVTQAVTLAKAVSRPVQVSWSREEDLRHDYYRPAAIVRVDAAVDAKGIPIALRYRIASQSVMERFTPLLTWIKEDPTIFEGAAGLPYAIENQRVEFAVVTLPVPVGNWRSVGHSITAFANESFIDELAHLTRADPIEYRLRLLQDFPRLAGVLRMVRDQSDWSSPLPGGSGRGVAVHLSFSSAVAVVAEVSIRNDHSFWIRRIVAAVDCGTAVNPDVIKAQIEGAIVFGLSATLFGKITIKEGSVQERNFPDYEMLRLYQMPASIDVHFVPSDKPPGGVGEVGVPPVAPAIANAIFAATGRRIRCLPLAEQEMALHQPASGSTSGSENFG
jgi:isoquinoline 1-oxidoreductase beta subunit